MSIARRNTKLFLTMCIIAILALTACGNGDNTVDAEKTERSEARDGLLGTIISVKAYGATSQDIEAVFDAVQQVDDRMSANKQDSEVSAINRGAYDAPVAVSSDVYEVIEKAVSINKATNGAFDPAIGGITKLWINESGAFSQLPDVALIKDALPDAQGENITLLPDNKIKLNAAHTRLDLGGIAKGYAADLAAQTLRAAGVDSAILDFGGDIMAVGVKPGAAGWTVGITVPYPDDDGIVCTVTAKDMAVVTSGAYQRFFEQDGTTYHHILDPDTGYPAETDLLSTTILGENATEADGYSTACFVLGLSRGLELMEKVDGFQAIFITKDHKIYTTSGLKQKLAVRDARFSLTEA